MNRVEFNQHVFTKEYDKCTWLCAQDRIRFPKELRDEDYKAYANAYEFMRKHWSTMFTKDMEFMITLGKHTLEEMYIIVANLKSLSFERKLEINWEGVNKDLERQKRNPAYYITKIPPLAIASGKIIEKLFKLGLLDELLVEFKETKREYENYSFGEIIELVANGSFSETTHKAREDFVKSLINYTQEKYKLPKVKIDVSSNVLKCNHDNLLLLICGLSPKEISNGILSNDEAKQWIMSEYSYPLPWFTYCKLNLGDSMIRTMKVARWVERVMANPETDKAFRRSRTIKIGDDTFEYSLISHLDEIMEEDIVTGKESVNKIIDLIIKRKEEAYYKGIKEIDIITHYVVEPPKELTILNSGNKLYREGLEMNHCVGSYLSLIRNNKSFIYSVKTKEQRTTLELTLNEGKLEVVQHKAESNEAPCEYNVKLVNNWINLNNQEVEQNV